MRRLIVALVVLGVLAVAADRISVRLADVAVARDVQSGEHLRSRPDVTIHGFPFLTQVVAGRYDRIDVTIHGLQRGQWRVDRVTAHLSGVSLPLAVIVGRGRRYVVVNHAAGDVWLTYPDLNAGLASRGLQVRPGGNGTVIVSGALHAGGADVQLSGRGHVTVVGTTVLVAVTEITSVAGVPLNVTAVQLDFSVPLQHLPFGLHLTGVTATDAGIDLTGTAGPVVVSG